MYWRITLKVSEGLTQDILKFDFFVWVQFVLSISQKHQRVHFKLPVVFFCGLDRGLHVLLHKNGGQ